MSRAFSLCQIAIMQFPPGSRQWHTVGLISETQSAEPAYDKQLWRLVGDPVHPREAHFHPDLSVPTMFRAAGPADIAAVSLAETYGQSWQAATASRDLVVAPVLPGDPPDGPNTYLNDQAATLASDARQWLTSVELPPATRQISANFKVLLVGGLLRSANPNWGLKVTRPAQLGGLFIEQLRWYLSAGMAPGLPPLPPNYAGFPPSQAPVDVSSGHVLMVRAPTPETPDDYGIDGVGEVTLMVGCACAKKVHT